MTIFAVSAVTPSSATGPGALVVIGLVLVAAGLALMTAAGAASSWTALLPGLVLTCAGTGLFNPAVVAIGLGSGVNDAFRRGGIAVGVAAFGALVPATAALGHGSAPR